jgi:serine/threonine protein kinase/predicted Zn-dependent protease
MKCSKCHSENTDTARFCSNCASPLTDAEDAQPSFTRTLETPVDELARGTLFANRYEIIEELGRGGMGAVYRVEDNKIKEEIALKLIKPEIAADKKTIKRFRNELTTARKIAHRNVCKMFDLGEDGGTHFITMEYVPGEDLKSFIRRSRRLSIPSVIPIAKQICEGLVEAHNLGIVHRDLKPSNIMVDKLGNARIMDFGIACTLESKGLTGAGVMIGTPEYMSPEQVEAKEIDQRSDIYSLGVILYEMCTGQLPFLGDSPLSIAMKHKGETPKNPKETNPQISDELSQLILKCLEKDKENRFQAADQIITELNNIEKEIPTPQREISKKKALTSKEITVSFTLKKLLIPALIVLAIAMIAIVIWQLLPQKETIPAASSDKPSLAIVYFENNTGDESLDHWRKALCELLIADLTQSKHIRVLSSDRLIDILNNLEQTEARSLSTSVLKQVAARGRSTHILRGGYTRAGEQFRIDAILQEASTMESVGSDRIEGKGEESFLSMVDELTSKIKAHFKLSEEEIAEDIDDDIGKITTSSPEALKYYIEGRKYHLTLDMMRSIELMEKAIAIDPEFAMAYRSMAKSYGAIGFIPQRKKYMEKALELSDRLPTRERFFIEADFLSRSEKTFDKAVEAYKKLLELYPDDFGGNANLAVMYEWIGERYKAIEHYEINRKNDVMSPIGYANLAGVYRQVGSYDKSKEVLEEALQKHPNSAYVYSDLALHYLMEGKYDLALAEINNAIALEPAKGTLAYRMILRLRVEIHFYAGDLVKAAEDCQRLLMLKQPQAIFAGSEGLVYLNIIQGKFKETKNIIMPLIDLSKKLGVFWTISEVYLKFAYIDSKSGNLKEALFDCDNAVDYALKAEDPDMQREALHLKGLAYVRMNATDEALKTADELRVLIQDSHNPNNLHFFHHLTGMIELKQKNSSKAIEHFEEALNLQSSDTRNRRADYIESLAKAYSTSGNLDRAQEEFENIISANSGWLEYGDCYARSFYELGKIYEQKGWKGKAIEHYQKFLDLWKDADPGLPEVADARERVAGLQQ